MKTRLSLMAALLAVLLLLPACSSREPAENGCETFPEETYLEDIDAAVTFRDGLAPEDYPAGTAAGDWLKRCSASDRDDHFDAYTLRHEAVNGDTMTFTYLIYYPHGGKSLSASPEVLKGESGYVINLTYAEGGSSEGRSLCLLSVTLPAEEAPRLRLLRDGEALGQMATVSEEGIVP